MQNCWSLPAEGEWIEISYWVGQSSPMTVSPCRGRVDWNILDEPFRPAVTGLSLQRESGLKCFRFMIVPLRLSGLSLQRESGLKCLCMILYGFFIRSLPAEGEWIEIIVPIARIFIGCRSLPAEGEWIEMAHHSGKSRTSRGLSLQRESGLKCYFKNCWIWSYLVSPCRGRVDWNKKGTSSITK